MPSRADVLLRSRAPAHRETIFSTGRASAKPITITRLNTVLGIYASIEFFAVAASAYIATLIYHRIALDPNDVSLEYVLSSLTLATLVLLISLGFRSFIAIRRQPRHLFIWRGVGAVVFAFSIFLTTLFIAKAAYGYSRGTFIFQIIAVGFSVASLRAIFHSWLRTAILSYRIGARRVALIGDDAHCSLFSDRMKANGIYASASLRLPTLRKTSQCNSKIRELIAACRSSEADDVIVLADKEDMPSVFDLVSHLAELPIGVHIVPIDALEVLATSRIADFGNVQTIQVFQPPLSSFDLFFKRTFDLVFSTIGLILLSPLYLIVSVAIKLDSPGPVFFRQTRHGFNNEEIHVLKFRSMTTMEDGGNFTEAVKNDPRVTRVGRIIRSTNIDELPQLINVMRGEMSIVGPRPHPTAKNAAFDNMIGRYSRRHNVKPGITGWAQVNGFRGETDTLEKMQRRVEYDLQYIDNWSLSFDLKIILMTVFSKKAYNNAY